ncbi:hypothetical protein D0T84_16250 [Dysgonomonas sp. 521]|uniref:hypothetical protein n=1 Tax=Dysgonomonas sp. 521 TaxID=2302932 RepID=UPI0013D7363C|nr:hypothetical protein [Dysgonomonas sp. 521]NDV96453.1 hypothetical protein [Dysgonomonas sp. 521]
MDLFSKEEFFELLKNGQIVDARNGGLVIGRSHNEGNIYMIVENENGYIVNAHMEGGEFLRSLTLSTLTNIYNFHPISFSFSKIVSIFVVRKLFII